MKSLKNLENILIPYYQPIFSLKKKEIIGYEGLSRFNWKGEILNFPQILKKISSSEKNLNPDIDWICRKKIIERYPLKSQEKLLFINIMATSIYSEKFGKKFTEKYVKASGLNPSQVVLEITESEKIQDIESLINILKYYKKQGFKLALDDFGTGYNTINLFFELSYYIDFIKLPLIIVQGVSKSFIKYELVKTFREISHNLGIKVIAEGVENEEDLRSLVELGTDYVQGFLISKPLTEKEVKSFKVSIKIPFQKFSGFIFSLKDWLKPVKKISITDTQKFKDFIQVFQEFSKTEKYILLEYNQKFWVLNLWEYARICSDNIKFNLLYMRPFTWILEEGKNISKDLLKPLEKYQTQIIDLCELTSPLELAILFEKHQEEVFFIKAEEEIKYYLVNEEVYEKLYKEVYKARIHINPLTGLPANVVIEEFIETLLNQKENFLVGYLDIDNFKAFNDNYGFFAGDNLIKRTAFFLSKYLKEHYGDSAFIGHIGGDDFVFVVKDTNFEALSQVLNRLIEALEKSVKVFFKKEDLERGYFIGKDREGNIKKFPLGSFSIAVVESRGKSSLQEIAKTAAQLKKIAKSHWGSKIVFEESH